MRNRSWKSGSKSALRSRVESGIGGIFAENNGGTGFLDLATDRGVEPNSPHFTPVRMHRRLAPRSTPRPRAHAPNRWPSRDTLQPDCWVSVRQLRALLVRRWPRVFPDNKPGWLTPRHGISQGLVRVAVPANRHNGFFVPNNPGDAHFVFAGIVNHLKDASDSLSRRVDFPGTDIGHNPVSLAMTFASQYTSHL